MDETPEFDAACKVSFEQYKEHGRELSNLPSEMQGSSRSDHTGYHW